MVNNSQNLIDSAISPEARRLISFCDSRLWRSAKRLESQAESLGIFGSVEILTEDSLDTSPHMNLKALLNPKFRGFGYWAWKPAAILQVLKKSAEGDLLLYVDVGCHLNPLGARRLGQYFEKVKESSLGILAFQAFPPTEIPVWDGRWLPSFPDAQWAKGDLLDKFEVRERPDVIETPTVGAGIIVIRNSESSRKFLEEWLEIMLQNISLVDDSPSISENHPWFIANRHDQAVFSLLAKTRGVPTLSAFEYWYPRANSRRADWRALAANPVHARRDLDFGPIARIAALIRRLAKGLATRLLIRSR